MTINETISFIDGTIDKNWPELLQAWQTLKAKVEKFSSTNSNYAEINIVDVLVNERGTPEDIISWNRIKNFCEEALKPLHNNARDAIALNSYQIDGNKDIAIVMLKECYKKLPSQQAIGTAACCECIRCKFERFIKSLELSARNPRR